MSNLVGAIVNTVLQRTSSQTEDKGTAAMSEVDLTPIREEVEVYKVACKEADKWMAIKKTLNEHFKELLGDSGVGTVDGVPAIKVTTVQSNRIDATLLKEEHPELYSAYLIKGTMKRLSVVKSEAL